MMYGRRRILRRFMRMAENDIERNIQNQPPQILAKKVIRTIIALLVVVGISLIIQSIKGQINVEKQTSGFVETKGYCKTKETFLFDSLGKNRRIRYLYKYYEYEVSGIKYTVDSARTFGDERKPGAEVTVKYNPEEPDDAIVFSQRYYNDLIIAGVIFFLGGLAYAVIPQLIRGKLGFLSIDLYELLGAVIFLSIGAVLIYIFFDDAFYNTFLYSGYRRASSYKIVFDIIAAAVYISGGYFLGNSFTINDLTSIKPEKQNENI